MFGVGEGRGEDRLLECVRRPGETRTECAKDPSKLQSQDPKLWWAPWWEWNWTCLVHPIVLCRVPFAFHGTQILWLSHSPIIALNPIFSFYGWGDENQTHLRDNAMPVPHECFGDIIMSSHKWISGLTSCPSTNGKFVLNSSCDQQKWIITSSDIIPYTTMHLVWF
jgi:hypothetical protein